MKFFVVVCIVSCPLIMLTLTCLTELPMSEEQPTSSQAGASGSGELPDILSIENIDVDLLPEHAEGQCPFCGKNFPTMESLLTHTISVNIALI